MDKMDSFEGQAGDPPGIVIRGTFENRPRPSISEFIWGGKVRPTPELPYGRRPAA
jgi:hypothetical protein